MRDVHESVPFFSLRRRFDRGEANAFGRAWGVASRAPAVPVKMRRRIVTDQRDQQFINAAMENLGLTDLHRIHDCFHSLEGPLHTKTK
jgi:hypothetical protein